MYLILYLYQYILPFYRLDVFRRQTFPRPQCHDKYTHITYILNG
jgi:hypothetical protein